MRIWDLTKRERMCSDHLWLGHTAAQSEEALIIQSGATDSKKLSAKKTPSSSWTVWVSTGWSPSPHQIDNDINTLEEEAFIDHICLPTRSCLPRCPRPRGIPAHSRMSSPFTHMDRLPEQIMSPKQFELPHRGCRQHCGQAEPRCPHPCPQGGLRLSI